MTLVLEDNWEKVELLLMRGLIKTDFYCSKYASDIMAMLGDHAKKQHTLFLDGEVCGDQNGVQFLQAAAFMLKAAIEKVFIISYHPGMIREMQDICVENNIPFEVLRCGREE